MITTWTLILQVTFGAYAFGSDKIQTYQSFENCKLAGEIAIKSKSFHYNRGVLTETGTYKGFTCVETNVEQSK